MNDASKVKPNHLQPAAYVYICQSSPAQVENNRESTARQYDLVEKVCQLGWAKEPVIVIDEDLSRSGSGWVERSGFAHHHGSGYGPRGNRTCAPHGVAEGSLTRSRFPNHLFASLKYLEDLLLLPY